MVVEAMRVRVFPDPGALSVTAAAEAAKVIGDAIDARGVANVMFASGNSQLEFLRRLTATSDIDWARVVGFHMELRVLSSTGSEVTPHLCDQSELYSQSQNERCGKVLIFQQGWLGWCSEWEAWKTGGRKPVE